MPVLLNVHNGMLYSCFNPCGFVSVNALTNNLEEIIQL